MYRIFMILKINVTAAVHLSLPWGCIHVYDNNSQTSLLVYIPDLRCADHCSSGFMLSSAETKIYPTHNLC